MNYNDINDEFDMENILHLNRIKPEVPNFLRCLITDNLNHASDYLKM